MATASARHLLVESEELCNEWSNVMENAIVCGMSLAVCEYDENILLNFYISKI